MKNSKQFIVLIFAVIFMLSGSVVFAQNNSAESENASAKAVWLDLIPLFEGFIAADSDSDTSFFYLSLGYEHQLAPHLTLGLDADLNFGSVYDVDYNYLAMAASGRYYIQSEDPEKLFVGASLGFSRQSIDGKTKSEYGGFMGLSTGLRLGYRLIMAEKFFVEPSIAYNYFKMSEVSLVTPSFPGWQGGLRVGMKF